MRIPLVAACVGLLAGSATPQSPIYSIDGEPGSNLGIAVDSVGDVDQDGVPDFIVGIWGDDTMGSGAGAARVVSGATSTELFTFFGLVASDGFGVAVSAAGDFDNDGFPDVAIGSWRDDLNGTDAGAAFVMSGKDATLLRLMVGDFPGDRMGLSLRDVGDTNLDGFGDVLVGASCNDTNGADAGMARLFYGQTAQSLTLLGDSTGDSFGAAVGQAGDLSGDGVSELLVGAWGDDNNGADAGSVRTFLGHNGAPLFTVDGDSAGDFFGGWVDEAGDVNLDGAPDFIVGACGDDNNGLDSGSARVFSGGTFLPLHTFDGDSAGDGLGYPSRRAGDLDGDGHADLIVGSYGNDVGGADAGFARVYSGATGATMHTFFGEGAGDGFGLASGAAGDLNCDGVDDVLVAGDLADFNGANSGRLVAFSGSPLPLIVDRHEVSVTTGGQQTLTLDAGAVHQGRPYLMLGSISGTKPGLPVGPGLHLPIHFDAWTQLSIQFGNNPLLPGFSGLLGLSGDATAAIIVPPGQPASLAGLTLHHAFLVHTPAGFILATSNAVPLTLTP